MIKGNLEKRDLYFALWFWKDESRWDGGAMSSGDMHGGRSRELRAHIYKGKQEVESEHVVGQEYKQQACVPLTLSSSETLYPKTLQTVPPTGDEIV